MIVVVVLGILAAMGVANFNRLKTRSLEASVKSNMHTLQLMVEEYSSARDGNYPRDSYVFVEESPLNFSNPFTEGTAIGQYGSLTEGEVGYDHDDYGPESYTIVGAGRGGTMLALTLTSGF
jgi:type II secretory pathway pseudopilin PulG